MINRSAKTLQNIHIEFSTQNDVKILEKAPPVTLQSGQTCQLKTSIKFSSAEVGIIYGTINYENTAGIEQPYIVSKEILIDLIDFIFPASIDIDTYRKLWAKYEWENRFNIQTNITDLYEFMKHIEARLNMRQVVE